MALKYNTQQQELLALASVANDMFQHAVDNTQVKHWTYTELENLHKTFTKQTVSDYFLKVIRQHSSLDNQIRVFYEVQEL